MANYITEDDIEISLINILKSDELAYNFIQCDANPNLKEDLNDGTSRTSKKQCVLPEQIKTALYKLNPDIPSENIDSVIRELCRDFTGTDMVKTNYDNYNLIRNGKKVDFKKDGKPTFDFVKLIDFENPENNIFTAVSQMWIQGQYYWRRPDVIIFVNGLPVVFVELKNAIIKIEEAFNKNLTDYKKDIPNLFAFNQICVLSNGLETRLGAWNADYEYFFEWLKVDNENVLHIFTCSSGVSETWIFPPKSQKTAEMVEFKQGLIALMEMIKKKTTGPNRPIVFFITCFLMFHVRYLFFLSYSCLCCRQPCDRYAER